MNVKKCERTKKRECKTTRMQKNANTNKKKNEGKKLQTQKPGRNDANAKTMKTKVKVKHMNAI